MSSQLNVNRATSNSRQHRTREQGKIRCKKFEQCRKGLKGKIECKRAKCDCYQKPTEE